MSCGNKNFKIKSTRYKNISYKIPCRYCVNCRIDNRRQWEVRAEYEFKQKITGTFLTLTYDEENLAKECIVKGYDNELRASLNYDNVRKFIENVRKYCKDHKEENCILRQENFSYIGCGEYGTEGKFNRPHWHILIFGLDSKYNKKLYEDKWKKGIIDSKPILNGAIRYILKYMDKQIMGRKKKWEYYGRFKLENPRLIHSKEFGSNIFYENYKNIKENNGILKSGMKYIPVPQYYLKKMGIFRNENLTIDNQINYLKNKNIKINNEKYKISDKKYWTLKARLEDEMEIINEIKKENEIQKNYNLGIPVDRSVNK